MEACAAFWRREPVQNSVSDSTRRSRPGRSSPTRPGTRSADNEVKAATELWLASSSASEAARAAAKELELAGETEHSAFWKYVEAHTHYEQGSTQDVRAARRALDEAILSGPRTVWFRRLERTSAALAGSVSVSNDLDDLFLAWDTWIRESGNRIRRQLEAIRTLLKGTHNEQCEALKDMGRLVGVTTQRPARSEQSAPDCIWMWISPRGAERRVWEVKTGGPTRIPRGHINQLLGQVEVARMRSVKSRVLGCLMTEADEIEPDAAEAARDKVAIVNDGVLLKLVDLLSIQLIKYMDSWEDGSAQSRGRARSRVEAYLPQQEAWLTRLLVPSAGKVLSADDVVVLFPST